jgi:hypothetical protein
MDFENYIKTEIDTKGNTTKIAFMHLAGKSIILPIYNPTELYIRYCNFGFSAFYHLQFCLTQSFHYTLFQPKKESLRYSSLAVFILEDGFNVWDDLTVWDVKVV